MEIKVIKIDDTEEVLDLSGKYQVSLSHSFFKDIKTGHKIDFDDIKEILFNENKFIMQMVDGIRDACVIYYEESDRKIKLGLYND